VGPQRGDPLFRQEAIEEYLRGREHGVPLRVFRSGSTGRSAR
jgi:hypothetical protein